MPVSPGFINRDDEINQITSLFRTLNRPALAGRTDAYFPDCIINLHGPPGIGKSALLHELRAQLAPQGTVLLIDLRSPLPPDRLIQEKLRFISIALQELERLPAPPDLTALRRRLSIAESTQSEDGLEAALMELLSLLQQRAEQQVIVLLIDSCEHASEALFAWLERFFLLPLIHDPGERPARTMGVFASQILLRWRQHNVRRRVKAQPLGPLSQEATVRQVGDPALGSALFQLTSGHALANRVAIEYLQRQSPTTNEQRTWITEHADILIGEVVARLREHAAASMLAAEATLPEGWEKWDVWTIIEPLAILREFDVTSMRSVLETYHQSFARVSQSLLLIFVRELLKTRLVEWNSALRAYQIAPAIRQIFAQSLKLRQPEVYATLRATAVAYYANQIGTVPSNRNLYLIEYAFQLLNDPATTPERARHLAPQFEHLLATHYANASRSYFDDEGLTALERMLMDDTELQEALRRQCCDPELLVELVRNFRRPDGVTADASTSVSNHR